VAIATLLEKRQRRWSGHCKHHSQGQRCRRKATRGDSLIALKGVLIDAVPVQAMRLDRASADAVDHPYDHTAVARFNWPAHLSLRGHRRIGARRSRPLASGNGFSDWSGNQTLSNGLSAGQLVCASNGVGFFSRCSD